MIFNSYITFLGHVSVLLVDDDDDDILPVVLISSHVGVHCHVLRVSDDERNCLSPLRIHGPGRADSPRPRDDDDDDDDAPAAAVRWDMPWNTLV